MKFSNSERQVNTHSLLVRKIAILAVAFSMLVTSPGMAFMSYANEQSGEDKAVAEQSVQEQLAGGEKTADDNSAVDIQESDADKAKSAKGDVADNSSADNATKAEKPAEEVAVEAPAEDTEEPVLKYNDHSIEAKTDDYEITVRGNLPEGASLEVAEIAGDDDAYEGYAKSAADVVFDEEKDLDGDALPYARFFDITIKDAAGNVFEPAEDVVLTIDPKDKDVLKTEDVTFKTLHFEDADTDKADIVLPKAEIVESQIEDKDDKANLKKDEEAREKVLALDVPSFSVYGVVYFYTVDFFYNDAEYHMNGGSEMKLSELFGKLGIDKDVKDVEKVEFTDDSLVIPTKDGYDYNIKSLKPFRTSETLTVTFKDGNVINIMTKDAVSGTVGTNVVWELSDDGKLVIKPGSGGDTGTLPNVTNVGNPPTDDNLTNNWPWYAHKNDITSVVVEEGVSTHKEARGMFAKLPNLETADLSGLDANGLGCANDMFRGSSALETLILPGSFAPKQAWRMCMDCSALTKVTIGSTDKPFNPGEAMEYRRRKGLGYMPSFQQFDTDGSGSYSGREAFSGCTSLTTLNMPGAVIDDINGENNNTRYVQNLFKSFDRANGEPKTINMEGADLTGGNEKSALRSMFKLDTLDTLNLSGSNIHENALRVLFHNVDNKVNISDYNACQALRDVDMTNVTFEPVAPPDAGYGTVSALNMFKGLQGLETVDMSGAVFPDGNMTDPYGGEEYNACTSFQQMFDDCTNLKSVTMANTDERDLNVKGATNMQNVFRGCSSLEYLDISGFGELPNITNMNGFLGADNKNCTSLETLIIDNLDNSAIQPRRGSEHDHSSDGRMMFTWGDPSTNLPSLKTVSANNSKVWFVKNNEVGLPSAVAFNTGNESNMYYLSKNKMIFVSDVATVTIDSKRDWIDLWTDHEGQSSGSSSIPDAKKNINYNDGKGHLNTNGAGFLAPGVYTITDKSWKEPTLNLQKTFYRISKINNSTPTAEVSDRRNRIVKTDSIIQTKTYTKEEWAGSSIFDVNDNDDVIDNDNDRIVKNADKSPVATITYPDAAEDIYGQKHNVIVKINSITFKNVDRIKESENVRHDPNNYVTDSYYRPVIRFNQGDLTFINEAYNTGNKKIITDGSGTYIDFDVEIADALPDTSVLFYMEDLDHPARQVFKPGIDPADNERDWHFAELPFHVDGEGYGVTYGPGSEGMILGNGNDLGTVELADHTGLEIIGGNEIVPTGSDPSTPWSAFTVRAAANGANYTWTSGVACETQLLRQTAPPDSPNPVYVMPEALKRVNGSIPSGAYANEYFTFDLKPATDVTNAVNYAGNDEADQLSNGATAAQSDTKTNNGEFIHFKELEYDAPKGNGSKAYIYEISEQSGTPGDIIKYDTNTKFYMQVVVSDPATDLEMYQGTKAEIITGIKTGNGNIIWDTNNVVTVWANDAVKTDELGPNGETVFKDAQGIEFYRKDGKFYALADDSELTPAKHAQVAQKVEYNGKEYDVKVDKNGVEYFEDDKGKYRNPNDPNKVLIAAREGDYDPDTVANDSPVAVKKTVDENEVKEDVHGVEYYGTYKALDGSDLTVEDGVFNPDTGDKNVYINKKKDGATVYKHANNKEYYVKNGKYYDAETDDELTPKTAGDVDPLPNDKNATVDEIASVNRKETVTGQAYTIRVDKNGIKYYLNTEKNNYYTPYGTLLEPDQGRFEPDPDDEPEKITREIWIDKAGTRFYKNEGKYFKEDGTLYNKLSAGTVDTSEVVDVGTFHNESNYSEITIKKTTNKAGANDKAGVFKFNVEFDNDFEPQYLVYEPGSTATCEQVSETPNTWQFTVEDGQEMTIRQVPYQTTYKITEVTEANGWLLTAIDGNAGEKSVSKKVTTKKADGDKYNKDYAHTFTNEFTEIILDKKVTKGDKTKAFSFEAVITVTGLADGEEFTYGWMDEANNQNFKKKAAGGSGTDTATISGLSLKNGEDLVIVAPEGAKVVITETAATGYKTTSQVGSGTAAESKVATVDSATDGTKVHFTNELELTEKTATQYVTRTITYTEDTATGKEVASTKSQKAYLKKTYYEDAAGKTYDAEGNPINVGNIPWVMDDSKESDTSAVTSPDHPKKVEEEWNPNMTKVDTWVINMQNPQDVTVNVIYTKDTYTDSEETTTIKRTITYTEYTKDGKKVSEPVIQEVTLKRSVRTNDRTREKTYGNWEIKSGDYGSVNSPDKTGWAPDQPTVPEWDIDLDNPKNETVHVVYTPKTYTVTYEDGAHGKSSGGSEDKNYGDKPQDNNVTPDAGYEFTGEYEYTIKDEDGTVIDSGTTDNPKSITVTGNIVFTPKYEEMSSDITGDETWGAKNDTQTGKPNYEVNPENPVTPEGLKDPADGSVKSEVSIPGEGTYTLNENGTITFKPEVDYVGDPTPIKVVGKDLLGNEKIGTYTPHVVNNVEKDEVKRTIKYVYSTGDPAAEDAVQTLEFVRTGKVDPKTGEVSYDGAAWEPVYGDTFPAVDSPDIEGWTPDKAKIDAKKGEVGSGDITETVTYNPGGMSATSANSVDLINLKQTGRPVFTAATKKLPDGSENTVTVRLVDPETEKATDSKTVDALDAEGNKVGTYTIGDDGTITYTPENGYVGTPEPATVEGADRLGHTARTTYSPRIVDPTEEEAASRTVHFAYLNKRGKPVTTDVVQTVTLVRHAAEVERDENGKAVLDKKGDVIVTKWSAWEPATFPAVTNPDKEAGAGWTTSDSVSALTVNEPGKVDDEYVVYVKKHYTVTYEDGEHGSSNGGSKDKEYGDTPQGNKVKADDGYKFTGRYKYVITDENGKIIDSGTTDNPKSIEVIGNIVFTPEYEKIIEPEPEPDNDSKTNPKSSGGTATGDYTRIGIWVALIAAAMAAIIFVIIRRRRSE